MQKIKRYDSEIAYTDFHIGRLIGKLKELGLYEDALIVFQADHGESFGEHNYLKHGKKLYNSTLHVPLVIKPPQHGEKNMVRKENVSVMDIAPAIFSTLDLLIPSQMQGLSLMDEDAVAPNRQILLETYGGMVRFRRKSKKYHLKIKPIRYGIVSGPFKVIYNLKDKTMEAYHQGNDGFEMKNIYIGCPLEVKEIKDALVNKADRVSKYIKLNRAHHLNNSGLTQDDLNRLKSLGYIYEKE
ncbi:MAG: sulfatase-like hydrolase/transferase [bacterium]|nr:sulfatase-like hydrolase/transferase [bacterium]